MSVQESPFDCRDARALCRAQPTLASAGVTLRRLRRADAPSLLVHLMREPVRRYTGAAPSSVSALTRFIAWTRAERCRGLRLCYGIVVPDEPWAVGLIEMWSIDRDFSTAEWGFVRDFSTAEWGFVLSDLYWGSGVFQGSAALLAAFAFQELGVFRLEARVVETNGRANGALQKLGATCEGVLRGGFRDGTTIRHQRMWSILASEWSADRSRIREHR